MKKVKLKIITFLLMVPFILVAQDEEIYEVQFANLDTNSNQELEIFQMKFDDWIREFDKDSTQTIYNKGSMVNNFIIFSQDGLIMKDLNFHTVESCQKQILDNLPIEEEQYWIYITIESQVNKSELIEILDFLKEKKIDYRFGNEGDFVPYIMKNGTSLQAEENTNSKAMDFEKVKQFYVDNLSDKDKLKIELFRIVRSNPVENSNLFAFFILNSNEPFFYMGGATYNEIGKHVKPELNKKVCLHLLENVESSKDLWFDIQQIGRWVGQDFVPRERTDLNHSEKIQYMIDKMMDYFETEYKE